MTLQQRDRSKTVRSSQVFSSMCRILMDSLIEWYVAGAEAVAETRRAHAQSTDLLLRVTDGPMKQGTDSTTLTSRN